MKVRSYFPALIAGLFVTLSASAAPEAAVTVPSPGPWLHQTVDRAKKLAERKVQAGTPAETAWQKEIKEAIDDVVDWPEMTQKSLGKGWNDRTPKEREEFSKLLRSLVEASYQSKLRLVANDGGKKATTVELTWDPEKIEGTTATARAHAKDGKTTATIDFNLRYDGKRWRVWDVTLDEGSSTVNQYRSQFTKVISEKGFPALMEKLKKKYEEVKAGKGVMGAPQQGP